MLTRSPKFDYVIVGAGAAGCVLAHRLTEDPAVRVALLEAGSTYPRARLSVPLPSYLWTSSFTWPDRTEEQPHLGGRSLPWPSGRISGGSAAISGMIFNRGNRADYDGWAAAGNRGWGYSDVLPYFRRAEDHHLGETEYHGAGGPLAVSRPRYRPPFCEAFIAAGASLGIPPNADFSGAQQEGIGYLDVLQRRGLRVGPSTAYLRPASSRPNLTLLTGTHVTRVTLERRRAVGVAFHRHGRRESIRAEAEVILCAGAVRSPHLLMMSGVGPGDQLRNVGLPVEVDLPGVGRNLQDHLKVPTAFRDLRKDAAWPRLAQAAIELVLHRTGLLTSNVCEAGAFVRSRPDLGSPDIQLVAHWRSAQREVHALDVVLVAPKSRGSVTLRSANPIDPPRIDPAYLSHPDDRRALQAGIQLVRKLVATEVMRVLPLGEEILPGPTANLERHVEGHASSTVHAAGTCRMGEGDEAVVDDRLRVRGVEGLRVVDASIMPRIIAGQTSGPTVMIAEKASDLVRAESSTSRDRATSRDSNTTAEGPGT